MSILSFVELLVFLLLLFGLEAVELVTFHLVPLWIRGGSLLFLELIICFFLTGNC